MSTVMESLKVERNRLIAEAAKVQRAILVLDPTEFLTIADVKSFGNGNGNGVRVHGPVASSPRVDAFRKKHGLDVTRDEVQPRTYRKKSKERLSFLRRSRKARQAWANKTPEQRAEWVARIQAGRKAS